MAEDTTNIDEALSNPKQVTVDGMTVTERTADEIIKLDRANKGANLSSNNMFRRTRLKPPGADGV